MSVNCLAHPATSTPRRCSVGGNHDTVQGKYFAAYSYEVVAVMDIMPASTAMGMAAMMTGSGTGPRATRVFSTSFAISTEPFCGSSAVSTPTTFTGLPLMPPAALISRAACWAPQSRYSPIAAMGPVRAFRNGTVHSFTSTSPPAKADPAASRTRSSTPRIFLIRPPFDYSVSFVPAKERFRWNTRACG